LTKISVIVNGVQLTNKIMRPSLNRTTEIKARCTEACKKNLTRKLISVGYARSYGKTVNPDLVNFVEVLADKPLEWFQENFGKVVDISE
jgi:hypothetical protein